LSLERYVGKARAADIRKDHIDWGQRIEADIGYVEIYLRFRSGEAETNVYIGWTKNFDAAWFHRVMEIEMDRERNIARAYIDFYRLFCEEE